MKQKLLQDAPGLEEQVAQWRQDPKYQEGAKQIAEAVLKNDRSASIYESPEYPEFALLAYLNDTISLAQFSTITFQWNGFEDFEEDVEEVSRYTISEINSDTTEVLRPYLRLLVSGGFLSRGVDVPLPQADLERYIESLIDESVPESERSFTLLRLKEGAKLPDLFYVFNQVGFQLFQPIYDGDQPVVLIPSFTMLENFLRVLSDSPIKLIPAIGDTSGQGVLDHHEEQSHPLGLSFPGYKHSMADGYESKMWMFVLHDIYHIVLIIFVKILSLINRAAQVGKDYLEEKSIPESSILHQRVDFLVDAELGQYYINTVLKKYGMTEFTEKVDDEMLSDEFAFANLLSRVLMAKISGVEALKEEDPENQRELVARIIADFINQREAWQRKGIDVAKCLMVCANAKRFIDSMDDEKESDESDEKNETKSPVQDLEKLEEITLGILRKGQYQEYLDGRSKEWLKLIAKTESELFESVNAGEVERLKKCVEFMRTEQLPISLDSVDATNKTLLSCALNKQNSGMVKALLDLGADPNKAFGKTETIKVSEKGQLLLGARPVHIAARKNNLELLKLLVERGADLSVYDSDKRAPIDIAMECGHVEAFNFLLQKTELADSHLKYRRDKEAIDEAIEPLIQEYQERNKSFIKLLKRGDLLLIGEFLDKHPAYTPDTRLLKDSYTSCENPFLLVPEDYEFTSAIDIALETKNMPLLAELFGRVAQNQSRNLRVFRAIQVEVATARQWSESAMKMLDLLLKNGFPLNQYLPYSEGVLSKGKTLSYWGILRDISFSKGIFSLMPTSSISMSTDARKMCIRYGANVDEQAKNGRPEIIHAAIIGDCDYAEFLLSNGANVNILDRSSVRLGSALHVACGSGNKEMVKLLASHGGDWTLRNQAGLTPKELADRNGFAEVLAEFLPIDDKEKADVMGSEDTPVQTQKHFSQRFKFSSNNEAQNVDYAKLQLFSLHPELKAQLRGERSNPLIEIGRSTLCEQLNKDALDLSHPIFSDPQLWHFALQAVVNNSITEQEFSTLVIRSAYLRANADKIETLEHLSLTDRPKYMEDKLRRFLPVDKNKADAIIKALKESTASEMEKTLTLITLKKNTLVQGVMRDLYRQVNIPLLPIVDGERALILIPSFTLINTIITTLFSAHLKLRPILGQVSPTDYLRSLKEGCYPLEMRLGSVREVEYLFASYASALMLSASKERPLLFKMIEMIHSLSEKHPILENTHLVKFFSDAKGLPLLHYTKALLDDQNRSIAQFNETQVFDLLLSDFAQIEEIPDADEIRKAAESQLDEGELVTPDLNAKIDAHIESLRKEASERRSAVEALFEELLIDIIAHRETWEQEYQFSAGRFLDQLANTENKNLAEDLRKAIKAKGQGGRGDIFGPMGGLSFEDAILSAHCDEVAEIFEKAAIVILKKAREICSSQRLSKEDQDWSMAALSNRKALLDTLVQQDRDLLSTLQDLNQSGFDFSASLLDGSNILIRVTELKNAEAVSLLCENGVDPNCVAKIDDTLQDSKELVLATRPVHIAAQNNDLPTLSVLCEKGASLEVYNAQKLSPLSIALIGGHAEIVAFCLKRLEISSAYVSWLKKHHSLHSEVLPLVERYLAFRRELSVLLDNRQTSEDKLDNLLGEYPEQSLDCFVPLFPDKEPSEAEDKDFQHCKESRDSVPALHKASSACALKNLQLLLDRGLSLNVVDRAGNTCLMSELKQISIFNSDNVFWKSIRESHSKVIVFLLERECDLLQKNDRGDYALNLAVKMGDLPIVIKMLQILDKEKEEVKQPIIQNAFLEIPGIVARNKGWTEFSVELFRLFLKSGVDFSQRVVKKSFLNPFQKEETQSLWQYCRSMPGPSPNLFSTEEKSDPIQMPLGLRFLCVAEGADVDEPIHNGEAEVFYAIREGHADYLAFLLECDASLKVTNADNMTPVQYAAQLESKACISVLNRRHNTPSLGFAVQIKTPIPPRAKGASLFHNLELDISLKVNAIEKFLAGKNKDLFQVFGVMGDWSKHRSEFEKKPGPFYGTKEMLHLKNKLSTAYQVGNLIVPLGYSEVVKEFETLVEGYNKLVSDEVYLRQCTQRHGSVLGKFSSGFDL